MSWGNYAFAQPYLLWLLAALPVLALLRTRRAGAPAVVYASLAPFRGLGKPRRARSGGWWFGLLLLGLTAFILALARPQRTSVAEQQQASGIDIMLALDVSKSMLADDMTIGNQPANRLDAVKKVTEDFITARKNDRIGMIAFSGRPYLVSPLTLGHDWLLKKLERVRTGLVEDGTAIGSAIASSANRLKDQKGSKSRIIVLLTDGDNNVGPISPVTAAEAAHALGIKIYSISVSSGRTARIPMQDAFGRRAYYSIPALVDEKTLQRVAEIGEGAFYRATDGRSLENIFAEIDRLEKTKVQTSRTQEYHDLFPWFLGVGAAFIGVYFLREYLVAPRMP